MSGVDTTAPPSKHIPPAGGLSLNMKVFTMPKGILRLIELVLTLIAFSTTSSVSGFSNSSQFSFVVAANVIAWVYVLFLCVCYIFRDKVDDVCFWLPIAELVLDGLMTLLLLIAGAVGIDYGNKSQCVTVNVCNAPFDFSDANPIKAGCAFSILAFAAFAVSVFFDYKEHRALEKHGAGSTTV